VVLKITKIKKQISEVLWKGDLAIGRGTAAVMGIVTNPLMSDHQNCVRCVTGVWHQAFLFLAIFRILGTPKKRSQCKR
jgi:hypothetical protein